MSDEGVFSGLGRSAFISDMGGRDRSALRLAATIVGGAVVGMIAAVAGFILVLVAWVVIRGEAGAGLAGIGHVAVALQRAGGRDLGSALLVMSVAAATNVPIALAFVALAALIAHKRLLRTFSSAPALRWRLLLAGLVMSALAVAPVMLLDRLISTDNPPLPLLAVSPRLVERAAYVVASFLLLVPAAAAEEIVFRGWLLRQVAAFTRRPAVLIILTAVIFSALHLQAPSGDLASWLVGQAPALLTRAVMGAGFAYMTLRLGGIEFSTGAHAANNILIVLFVEPLTMQTLTAASNFSLGSIAEDAILAAGYIVITEVMARNLALRRWAGVSDAEVSPTPGAAR